MNFISRFLAPNPEQGSVSGTCGVCGLESDGQFHRNDILQTSGANITSLFPFNTATMCPHCAAIWREPKKWHRAILAYPDRVLFPSIAPQEYPDTSDGWKDYVVARTEQRALSADWKNPFAKSVFKTAGWNVPEHDFEAAYAEAVASDKRLRAVERPVWSDAVREIPHDVPRAIVLNTDPKKRVWPKARVSSGRCAWVYVHDTSRAVSDSREVDLVRLVECLDVVEACLALGFSKFTVEQSLYSGGMKLLNEHGPAQVTLLERRLAELRRTPEFVPAVIVSRRREPATSPEEKRTPSLPIPAASFQKGTPSCRNPIQPAFF